jgi:hypothetical protein
LATLFRLPQVKGATYTPSRDALKVANLQTLFIIANAVITNYKTTEMTFDNATNALDISDVTDSVLDGARIINRNLQEQRTN